MAEWLLRDTKEGSVARAVQLFDTAWLRLLVVSGLPWTAKRIVAALTRKVDDG